MAPKGKRKVNDIPVPVEKRVSIRVQEKDVDKSSTTVELTTKTVTFATAEPSSSSSTSEVTEVRNNVSVSTVNSSRRDAQRAVAERRAAHFARADTQTSSLRNSTPTGSLRVRKADSNESWPGPFATAYAIMEKRAEAKKAREDAINAAKNTEANRNSDMNNNEDEVDIYEAALSTLSWTPSSNIKDERSRNEGPIPELTDLCIQSIVSQFGFNTPCETYRHNDFEMLSPDATYKLSVALAKQNKLSPENAMIVAIPESQSLVIPECSNITEEDLLKMITKVSGDSSKGDDGLIEIRLNNSGRSFTDVIATQLTKHCKKLTTLDIKGCYKLSDEALTSFLINSCGSSLTNLDLSCNLRLGSLGLSVVGSLPLLQSLTLNDVTHLTDANLNCLRFPIDNNGNSNEDNNISNSSSSSSSFTILPTLKSLQHLSLSGLIELTDISVVPLIDSCGTQLRSLNISGCVQLTDHTIIGIRNTCCNLRSLDVSQLPEVTTAALIGLFIMNPTVLEDNVAADSNDKLIHSSIGRLQYVNLQGNVNATDEVLIHLCELTRTSLTSLNINGCHQLTNLAAVALKMNCSQTIEVLDMSFVRGFTEDALGSLVDSCTNLRSLHIWGCTQLTSRFFNGHKRVDLKIVGRMIA